MRKNKIYSKHYSSNFHRFFKKNAIFKKQERKFIIDQIVQIQKKKKWHLKIIQKLDQFHQYSNCLRHISSQWRVKRFQNGKKVQRQFNQTDKQISAFDAFTVRFYSIKDETKQIR